MGITTIRPVSESDKEWVRQVSIEHWASEIVVSRNSVYLVEEQLGFIAELENERVGLATYRIEYNLCELLTLNSLIPGQGIGSQLLSAIEDEARRNECKKLWVITTNNNLEALGFYQKKGFLIKDIHRNAVERSRRLKPEIPLVADNGIPIRDEIELEKLLME